MKFWGKDLFEGFDTLDSVYGREWRDAIVNGRGEERGIDRRNGRVASIFGNYEEEGEGEGEGEGIDGGDRCGLFCV